MRFSSFVRMQVLGCLAFLLLVSSSCDFGTTSRYYFLDLVNSGTGPATVTVNLAEGSWTVGPGESKTFKVEKQKDADSKTEREFKITINGKTTTAKTKVGYSAHVCVDVTGSSCILAVDYGAQYRDKTIKLPEGESDVKVLKVFRNEMAFKPETWDNAKSTHDFLIQYGVGEKLPEKIKLGKGSTGIPKVVRLVAVPCEKVDDPKALYQYLNSN